jgi:hypothetical protein
MPLPVGRLRRSILRRQRAACRGRTDLFFPKPGDDVSEAKALCRTCPMAGPCGEFALARSPNVLSGVWGGMTARERKRLRRAG